MKSRWLSRCVLLSALAPCACGGTLDEPAPCRSLGSGRQLCGGTAATVPMVASDGSALVDARIDGHGVQLLVDTGSEMTVLAPALVGGVDHTLVEVELCVGKLCLRHETVYLWETPFSSAAAEGPHGFIGMRTLKDFSVGFQHGASVSLILGSSPCAGASVPLTFTEYGIPMLSAGVGSLAPAEVSVDTGATYTLLSQSSFDALGSAVSGAVPASLCTVDGCKEGAAFSAELSSYCVGATCESAVPVKYPVFDAVGMSFLSRRSARFDFPAAKLTFCD